MHYSQIDHWHRSQLAPCYKDRQKVSHMSNPARIPMPLVLALINVACHLDVSDFCQPPERLSAKSAGRWSQSQTQLRGMVGLICEPCPASPPSCPASTGACERDCRSSTFGSLSAAQLSSARILARGTGHLSDLFLSVHRVRAMRRADVMGRYGYRRKARDTRMCLQFESTFAKFVEHVGRRTRFSCRVWRTHAGSNRSRSTF